MALFSPVKNKVGLSRPQLGLLLALFRKVKDFDNRLHGRLLRYVLDGVEDDGALGAIGSKPDTAHALSLRCSQKHGIEFTPSWYAFLEHVEPVDCRFYLRLGKVFEAAATRLPADRFFCDAWFDGARWLEILLQEATRTSARSWSSAECGTAISGQLVEDMFRADGRQLDCFLTAPFRVDPKGWEYTKVRKMVLSVADLGSTFAKHRHMVVPFLVQGNARSRLMAVENLSWAAAPPDAFVEELVACAIDNSKQLRDAAEALLRPAMRAARPLLKAVARQGKSGQREHAVRVLGRIGGPDVRPFLESLRETEQAKAVQEALAVALLDGAADVSSAPMERLQPPPREPIPLVVPLTPALRACIDRLFDAYNEYAKEHNAALADPNARRHVYPETNFATVGKEELEGVCQRLESGGECRGVLDETLAASGFVRRDTGGPFKAILEHPDCALIHAVRLLAMVNGLFGSSAWYVVSHLSLHRRIHSPGFTLEDLAEAVRAVDLDDDIPARHALGSYEPVFDWEPDAVWPYFAARVDMLAKALDPAAGDGRGNYERERAFKNAARILTKFPEVPPSMVGRLWEIAIGTRKADRLAVQKVVEKLPDLQQRLAHALTSSAMHTRVVAAEWMGRLGDRRAVEPLHTAARKEKHDAPLDAMLTALERLGESIEPYLDRDKLQAAAQKGLKKGIPPALAWFPWQAMPAVHWSDSGKPVAPEILTWLLVQNFKFGSPEAGSLLRRYCALMDAAGRAALGDFVLGAWFEKDNAPKHTEAEARDEAQKKAAQWFQQWGHMHGAQGPTQQEMEEQFFGSIMAETPSAAKEKGILAVAAACCGPSAVAPVAEYLKTWFGYRAPQCKALIAMLSCVDDPAAIQYVLSIANRFRTKGIREEAEECIRLLAERKGWTFDELADRTMPTAGLDGEGKLVLSYGPREFVARVTADLQAVLSDASGKPLKSLPAPRKDDDEALVKAAKKSFLAARKGLKTFAGQQTIRLYEAMCTQRTWTAADWRTYLLGHPLLRFACQRLVWAACEGEKILATFRPLDDGTLTGPGDEEVALADDASVRLVHGSQVDDATAAAWTRHLADYEVVPLLTQFGRPTYSLPEDRRTATAFTDFEGHTIEAFALRGTATKLGYVRGAAQDGGWFFEYLKRVPGMELELRLNFSGNGLPEENRLVALSTLSFHRCGAPLEGIAAELSAVPLGDVPPVLLTECYNDLRTIAAAGKGFDPEWEKKVY